MGIEEVVEFLAMYIRDDGETVLERFGPEAQAAAEDLTAVVGAHLERNAMHATLWEEFRRAPNTNIDELMGVLEVETEGDPGFTRRVNGFMSEIRGQMAEPLPEEPETAETLADVGGDALDTAVEPDFEDGEAGREPYRPGLQGSGTEYNASVERGTYLYGNVKAGTDSLDDEVGVETFGVATTESQPEDVVALSGVPGLFEELGTAIDNHPVLSDAERVRAKAELDVLQDRLQTPEAVEAEHLIPSLRNLQELAPDVAEVVLLALDGFELPPPVEDAIDRLKLESPEEG